MREAELREAVERLPRPPTRPARTRNPARSATRSASSSAESRASVGARAGGPPQLRRPHPRVGAPCVGRTPRPDRAAVRSPRRAGLRRYCSAGTRSGILLRTTGRTRRRCSSSRRSRTTCPMNPFTAVGQVKPGPFRKVTINVILYLLNAVTRHFLKPGDLVGVKTIHFARWVFLDDRRQVLFASNYDGSLESYMDDFIDKISWGLNLVFTNGIGYPRTRWLIKDGCTGRARVQGLSAAPPGADAGLVPGIRSAHRGERRGERATAEGPPLGPARGPRAGLGPGAVTLELADIQGLFARGYSNLARGDLPAARARGRRLAAAAGSAMRWAASRRRTTGRSDAPSTSRSRPQD